jgi:hypothetical protein
MLGGCPLDRNIISCVLHYQPELMLLVALVVVGIILVVKHRGGGAPS